MTISARRNRVQKWLGIAFILCAGIIAPLGMTCGNQADKNLTSKNFGCENTTEKNSMVCCMQGMSSATGSDSKDSVCRPTVDENAARLMQERKILLYKFCQGQIKIEGERIQDSRDFQSCWDKLGPK